MANLKDQNSQGKVKRPCGEIGNEWCNDLVENLEIESVGRLKSSVQPKRRINAQPQSKGRIRKSFE